MAIEYEASSLKESNAKEWILRFVFGGLVTVGAGLVAHFFGPVVGGLFLAFPAILPASLTLVKKHDGRARAADDASGAGFGSFGLIAFAFVVWGVSGHASPATVLVLASVAWFLTSVAWWAGARGPS